MKSPEKNYNKRCNNKGSLYTLESAIAIIIMVSTLFMITRQPQTTGELDIANYKLNVYKSLRIASDVGDLRRSAMNNNTDAIESEVEENAPTQLNYEVVIYNKTGAVTSESSIDSENVLTVSYFLAGRIGTYDPREVRVFVWGFD